MPSWKKIIVSGSDASLNSLQITNLSNTVTSDIVYIDTVTGNLSYGAAGTVTSASYAETASYLLNYQAPFPFTGSAIITGSLIVTGSIYATDITSSLYGTSSFAETASFVTASNVFGPYGSNSIISSSYAVTSTRSNVTLSTQILVLNQSGYTITKGLVVHITASGNSSDIPRVISASYESDSFSANTLGIATENITNGSQGLVITEGVLTGVDTSLFQSGQLIYLGAQGTITGSAPHAPLHSVRLGQVIREQSNNGSIHVRVDNGYELGELHDVTDLTTSASYGDLLIKSGSVWTNSKQLTGSYGLTGSLTVTGSTSTDLVRITQTGTGNAFVVEDAANPDSTPFIIDNQGRVGIGTTGSSGFVTMKGVGAIGVTLDTDGYPENDFQSTRLFWKISGSGNDISMRNVSGSLFVATQATANGSSGTVAMTITASGSVGIGTTGPGASLHLSRTGDPNLLIIERNAEANATVRYKNTIGSMYAGLSTSATFAVGTSTDLMNASTTFLTVSASGNVGIGTTTPSAKLHVTNITTDNSFLVEDSTNPDNTPFIIDNQGRVGIGTINPAAKLQVDGDSYVNGGSHYIYQAVNTTVGHLSLDHSGVQMWRFGVFNDNTSTLSIGKNILDNNTRLFNITTGGNVGIGTTTPNAKLDVNGNTTISGSLTVTDGITASLHGTASYSILSLDTVNKATYTVGIMSGSENWSTSNNGTITLPTVDVLLYDNANFSGYAKLYTVPGGTTGAGGIPALTDNDTNYITIEYNGGSPIYNVSTADTSNDSNINLAYITYRLGNFVHILDFGNQGAGLANKVNRRIEKTNRFGRESGLNLSLSGSTGIAIIASGVAWNGSNRQTLAEANSNDDIFFKNYRVSSTWSYTTAQNYINNTYYDNGTDLVPITSGSYVVNWYYRGQELNDHIYEVVSQDEYANVAEARLATAPTLPELVESHAFLAGRIIVQSGSYDGIVESAYTSVFQATTVTSHNDLIGLQGGSGNEYYHLNANQYTNIALKNTNNHFTTGQTISGSLTVAGTYESPTGNVIDSNALIQASLLYLSNNF